MRTRITILILMLFLCSPGAGWGKQGVERYEKWRPYEVAFSWGDSATFWIMVHRDATLEGLDGSALADAFSQFLQGIMQERGTRVSGVERITDRVDFVKKLRTEGKTLRLFAVLYKGNRLHVYGNIIPMNGNGKTSTILPYLEIQSPLQSAGSAAFAADMKQTLAPAVNARIDQVLTELQPETPIGRRSAEEKNAQ